MERVSENWISRSMKADLDLDIRCRAVLVVVAMEIWFRNSLRVDAFL